MEDILSGPNPLARLAIVRLNEAGLVGILKANPLPFRSFGST